MRPSPRPVAHGRPFALALAVGAAVVVAGCASDEGGGPPPGTSGATTVPVLEQPVVDACGNDLGGLTSTVWGIDPATGEVRWRTEVPLAEAYVLRDPSGDPRLSLVLRPVEAVVDRDTGVLVETPPAGVHEVLVDPAEGSSGAGALLVDGERQPPTITVGSVQVSTAGGSTGQATVGLTGTDATSAAPLWRVELGDAAQVASVSPPVDVGGVVVVVTSEPRPPCP
jgi:outer membrane protein assembly factor BamB